MQALDLWTSGKATLCLPKHNPQLQIRYTNLKSSLMPKLSQFQIDDPGEWETFLSNVREPHLKKSIYLDPTELHMALVL